jgi:hypothetical protein
MSGNETKAQTVLVELEELSGKRYLPAYQMALVHVALGQNDEALALLEKAYEDRYPWTPALQISSTVSDCNRWIPRHEIQQEQPPSGGLWERSQLNSGLPIHRHMGHHF